MTNPTVLVVNLETPLSETDLPLTERKAVVMAGLQWETDYWTNLALGWIEQGFPVDEEIARALALVASQRHRAQALRHRAIRLARRWSGESGDDAT